MRAWRIDQFALLEEIEQLTHLQSDVLSNAVRCELALGEVLEHSA